MSFYTEAFQPRNQDGSALMVTAEDNPEECLEVAADTDFHNSFTATTKTTKNTDGAKPEMYHSLQ